jgi:hypothetical protein
VRNGEKVLPGIVTSAANGKPPPAALTTTLAEPVRPPMEAVMFAVPAATAVTRPVCDTDATVDALLLHAAVPVVTVPVLVNGVAVSCSVCPTPSWALVTFSETEATPALALGAVASPPPLQAAERTAATRRGARRMGSSGRNAGT